MGGGERRCVVQSVTDHQDTAALRFQTFDRLDFLCRCQTCAPLSDPEPARHRANRFRRPRQNDEIETARRQRLLTATASAAALADWYAHGLDATREEK